MEKIVKQALLYDFYGELLTDHQKQVYEDVILNDYSCTEVAEEYGISRQGVHDMIKRCNKILEGYENKLKLVEKFLVTKQMIERIDDLLAEYRIEKDEKKLEEIEQMTEKILQEM